MVKIYLIDKEGEKSKKYVDIYYFSLLKAYFLGWLGLIVVWILSLIALAFLLTILGI